MEEYFLTGVNTPVQRLIFLCKCRNIIWLLTLILYITEGCILENGTCFKNIIRTKCAKIFKIYHK